MRRTAITLLLGAACVAAGCRSSVSISHIQTEFVDVTAEGLTLVATFEFRNAGRRTEIVRSCDYRLRVAGTEFTRATHSRAIRVAAGSSSRIRLPVKVEFTELAAAIPEARAGTMVPFELTVQPHATLWGRLPFRDGGTGRCEGRLPIVAKPTASIKAIRVIGIEDRMVTLDVDLLIANPNQFPITLGRLNCRIEAARYPLGEPEWEGPKAIQAGEVLTLPLRLKVPLVTWQARLESATRPPCELSGSGEFSSGIGTFPLSVHWTGRAAIVRPND